MKSLVTVLDKPEIELEGPVEAEAVREPQQEKRETKRTKRKHSTHNPNPLGNLSMGGTYF